MKEYIQSYHALLPGRYMRWILYVIYPGLFIGGFLLLGFYFQKNAIILAVPLLLFSAECFLDTFIFGGFAAGRYHRMEWLKTSVRGMNLVKKGLIFDGFRRFLSVVLIMAATCLLARADYGEKAGSLQIKFVIAETAVFCVITTLVLFVIRFVDSRSVQLMTIFVTVNIPVYIYVWICMAGVEIHETITAVVGGVIYVAAVIIQIILLINRTKEGYYDERTKKLF